LQLRRSRYQEAIGDFGPSEKKTGRLLDAAGPGIVLTGD
jgi:hypothetical protein